MPRECKLEPVMRWLGDVSTETWIESVASFVVYKLAITQWLKADMSKNQSKYLCFFQKRNQGSFFFKRISFLRPRFSRLLLEKKAITKIILTVFDWNWKLLGSPGFNCCKDFLHFIPIRFRNSDNNHNDFSLLSGIFYSTCIFFKRSISLNNVPTHFAICCRKIIAEATITISCN